MNYLQIGVLVIVGFAALAIWWYCLVDINKDVTYHNRKSRIKRPLKSEGPPISTMRKGNLTQASQKSRGQVEPFSKGKGGRQR